VRRALSEKLSTGVRVSFFSSISGAYEDKTLAQDSAQANFAYVHPATWTFRYEPSDFLRQTFFNPWIEGEAGLSLVTLYRRYDEDAQLLRPTARGSIGFDLRPLGGNRLFVSTRASYLAVSEFSDFQVGVGTGVSF
jgi:hypothetical protein